MAPVRDGIKVHAGVEGRCWSLGSTLHTPMRDGTDEGWR